jgi:hypothetical protein
MKTINGWRKGVNHDEAETTENGDTTEPVCDENENITTTEAPETKTVVTGGHVVANTPFVTCCGQQCVVSDSKVYHYHTLLSSEKQESAWLSSVFSTIGLVCIVGVWLRSMLVC